MAIRISAISPTNAGERRDPATCPAGHYDPSVWSDCVPGRFE